MMNNIEINTIKNIEDLIAKMKQQHIFSSDLVDIVEKMITNPSIVKN